MFSKIFVNKRWNLNIHVKWFSKHQILGIGSQIVRISRSLLNWFKYVFTNIDCMKWNWNQNLKVNKFKFWFHLMTNTNIGLDPFVTDFLNNWLLIFKLFVVFKKWNTISSYIILLSKERNTVNIHDMRY